MTQINSNDTYSQTTSLVNLSWFNNDYDHQNINMMSEDVL